MGLCKENVFKRKTLRMSKILTFLCLLALSFTTTNAQKATIKGKVTDATTGEPLIGATIRSGAVGAVTSYDGTYSISLEAGAQELVFRYVGYQASMRTIGLETGQEVELDVSLEVEPTVL